MRVFFYFLNSILFCCLTASFAYAEEMEPVNVGIAPSVSSSVKATHHAIQAIDLELSLLKGELAQQNGQVQEAAGYLRQLGDLDKLPEKLIERALSLKAYVELNANQSVPKAVPFKFNPDNILVLLPTTGDYQVAGQNLLKGIQDALPNQKLTVIDTSTYISASASAFELWDLVKLYQPSFIFGPLQPHLTQGMGSLNTQVPMIMFNESQAAGSPENVRCLSPSRSQDLGFLYQKLVDQGYDKVLFLVGSSAEDQRLWERFQQGWLTPLKKTETAGAVETAEKGGVGAQRIQERQGVQEPQNVQQEQKTGVIKEVPFKVLQTTVTRVVDKPMERLMGVEKSAIRYRWLQKTIGEKLTVLPRARQDVDAVVSFMSASKTMQVRPLLNYEQLYIVDSIWFPAKLPSKAMFLNALPFWQNTQAILPVFQLSRWVPALSIQKKTDNKVGQKVGIFYALGRTAVQISQTSLDSALKQWKTMIGQVNLNEKNQLVIQPGFYRLNNNEIVPIGY